MTTTPRTPLVAVTDDGPVRTVALDRPARHNALVPALLDDLVAALDDVAGRDDVRAVVLAGNGGSLSTGGDVAGFAERHGHDRAAWADRLVGRLNDAILALLALPQPTVVAAHGPVTGGALGLVLACDVVVVEPATWFAPYYVEVGFSPDGGWTALLPDRIGAARATAVQLCNDRIDADTALGWGLATHIGEDARDTATRLAAGIARGAHGSIRATLDQLRPDPDQVAARLATERTHFVAQVTSHEATAGMAAWLRG